MKNERPKKRSLLERDLEIARLLIEAHRRGQAPRKRRCESRKPRAVMCRVTRAPLSLTALAGATIAVRIQEFIERQVDAKRASEFRDALMASLDVLDDPKVREVRARFRERLRRK